nr:site-specific DNA-methyltransferase [Maliibacterium massiliense]
MEKGMLCERYHQGPWQGTLLAADASGGVPPCWQQYCGQVALVYLDPPFLTGNSFYYSQCLGTAGWRAGQLRRDYALDFDRWHGDEEAYWTMMRGALETAHALLSQTGSIYVHVDARACVRMRLLLDEIFGAKNFLNEIIWHYRSGGRSKRYFSRKHDNILFYKKGKTHYFDIEAVGRPRGRGVKSHLKRSVDAHGKLVYSIRSGGRVYTYAEDDLVFPDDVWEDIAHLHQRDPQRWGYDTQKPEALLARIIRASSRPGDIVCDLFAGSCTTLAVAQQLGRRFLGMDKGHFALHIARKRLTGMGAVQIIAPREPAEPPDCPLPRVAASWRARADGTLRVDLNDVDMGADYRAQPDLPLLAPDIPACDGWGIGVLDGDVLEVLAMSQRTGSHPHLERALSMPAPQRGQAVLFVSDIAGRRIILPRADA